MTQPERTAAAPSHRLCLVGTGSPACIGGLAAYTRHLGLTLRDQGHQVTAVARFRTNPPVGVQLAAAEIPGQMQDTPFPTSIVAPAPSALPFLRRLPSLLSRPALQDLGIRVFDAAFQSSMARAIPSDTNAVHFVGAGWEMLGFSALKRARQIGAQVSVLPAVHPEVWGDSPLDVRLYNRCDRVFALTQFEADHLRRKGVTTPVDVQGLAPAVAANGNGTRFREKYELGGRPLILFIARRVPYKGYVALTDAMQTVLQAVPDACLVLLTGPGDTPAQIPAHNLREIVGASDTLKADALSACDIVCVPSTDESFGLVYVEGWLYKKPVVGGPAPAVRELIEENVTGFTVEQTPAAISDTLIRLLRDPALRTHLGEAGFQLQQERFTWDAVAAHYLRSLKPLTSLGQDRTRSAIGVS